MSKLTLVLTSIALAAALSACTSVERPSSFPTTFHPARLVTPVMGSVRETADPRSLPGGGSTTPAATYPFGMVQWGPDTSTTLPGGYRYTWYAESGISGFSLTHYSGAGCSSFQDVPILPVKGRVDLSPGTSWGSYTPEHLRASDVAQPGYYSVRLYPSGIETQLAATDRSAIGRFVFPSTSAGTFLVSPAYPTLSQPSMASSDFPEGTSVRIDGTTEITGMVTRSAMCVSDPYRLYFAISFDRPFVKSGTWNVDQVFHGNTAAVGSNVGAFVSFDTSKDPTVMIKIGLSYVSVSDAQVNVRTEDPGWNIGDVRRAASRAWLDALSRVQAYGGSRVERRTLYTALYHSFVDPNIFSDINGRYIGFDGLVHVARGYTQYDDISGWDSYRSQWPLLALLQPRRVGDMLRSMVADAQQGGGAMPRWEVANLNTGVMVGDSPAILVASAYAFGVRNFASKSALEALMAAARTPGLESGDRLARPGLGGYLTKGWVSDPQTDVWGSVSTTLEYEADDFALGQFARALGDKTQSAGLLARSRKWVLLFNRHTGYLQPRTVGGAFVTPFKPTDSNPQYYAEGNATQYLWMVPFDLPGLFARLGGDAVAVRRLNGELTRLNAGQDQPYAWMGNEPSFEIPWEYDFAGAPAKTEEVVRRIENKLFPITGLPGDDDGGAMSSWYVWAAIGLYPEIPGVAGFAIGSPLFPRIVIPLAGGHRLTILAHGASMNKPYVTSLRLNGRPYRSTWLPYSKIRNGGTLAFTLSATPPARSPFVRSH